jgi:hypothetical protein
MFSALLSLLKYSLFTLIILIAGAVIPWENRPISEHLLRWSRNSGLRNWVTEKTHSARELVADAKLGAKIQNIKAGASAPSRGNRETFAEPEREKLREILQ